MIRSHAQLRFLFEKTLSSLFVKISTNTFACCNCNEQFANRTNMRMKFETGEKQSLFSIQNCFHCFTKLFYIPIRSKALASDGHISMGFVDRQNEQLRGEQMLQLYCSCRRTKTIFQRKSIFVFFWRGGGWWYSKFFSMMRNKCVSRKGRALSI